MFARGSIGDTIFVIGLKIPGTKRGNWHGEVFVDAATRAMNDRALRNPSLGLRIVGGDSSLSAAYVKVPSREILARLRKLPFVYYVEPSLDAQESPFLNSGSPCDIPFPSLPMVLDGNGEIVNPPVLKENIDKAWSITQGAGVTLGLADAVIDAYQQELFADPGVPASGFGGGLSAGRLFEQQTPAPGEVCSHAPRMAILMAGPRNGLGTNGVAWRANLRSGGAINNPNITFGPSSPQVVAGIHYAANTDNVSTKHVVAIAFGNITHNSLISDEINTLYYSNDVLFIGAAGTAVWNIFGGTDVVVFPASKDEVFAVSASDTLGGKDPESSGNAKVELAAFSDNLVGRVHV